jgi:DnaK suppressor protein
MNEEQLRWLPAPPWRHFFQGVSIPGAALVGNLHVDIEVVRTRLLRRREELRARASSARADLRHESDPLSADSAEQVTQRENDDVLGAISHSAREELARLDAALRRLAQGRYTTCAQCGEDIEEERLAAVPYTDRCRACAERQGARGRSGH